MKTVVNNLGAEISVTELAKDAASIRVILTLTNESGEPLRLNAMYITAPSLVLKFVDKFGNPVPTGPPPGPEIDDGKKGRVELLPGKPLTHTFEGKHIFGMKVPPGEYSVMFRYVNEPGRPGEWTGVIETPRTKFVIGP